MGKITNPATISSQFNLSEEVLAEFDVVNVLLATDTLLFIDPMLLTYSKHPEIHDGAIGEYTQRFRTIIRLLAGSKQKGDAAWKGAERLFKFSEVSWTCLGYGTSVKGSGFGKDLVATTLDTASQIVGLGVDDVDLFMALALFEEGIGPDRISDMTTNIILKSLIAFTDRVNASLKMPRKAYVIGGIHMNLICNPCSGDPLVLVPRDIVRALPIAADWSDIARVVAENDALRERVNGSVGEIWANMTKAKKAQMKDAALRSEKAFKDLLEMLREVDPKPYDFAGDRNGEAFWTRLLETIPNQFPFDLAKYAKRKLDVDAVEEIVGKIVEQFRDLVENKGLWKELWTEEGKPRKEKASQRLFYAIAYAHCKANDLDLTPEADSGNGPVDFKVSNGFASKVVVEIKLSTNPDVVHGYEKQLEFYKKGEDTDRAFFLLVDVGRMGRKLDGIQQLRIGFIEEHGHASHIAYVNGMQRASASKRE
ncbi:hypothetical protein IP92_03433 [Pseudoduganella flava]|uniref:Protein NO VEIN C-terminal domain-containing protein n=1 Tax=Pseudoduganella flava TaxID=871742 RepID=A0A562PP79_9BURK|nr:hypothetical protein [Pseudoduganella flava]QGZ40555.1 hypothetical protein GO485_16815 [Pseudoduganella flava]TWI46000.1 hypothetical protein IP92_03433 [Pseudoduganella flava]